MFVVNEIVLAMPGEYQPSRTAPYVFTEEQAAVGYGQHLTQHGRYRIAEESPEYYDFRSKHDIDRTTTYEYFSTTAALWLPCFEVVRVVAA